MPSVVDLVIEILVTSVWVSAQLRSRRYGFDPRVGTKVASRFQYGLAPMIFLFKAFMCAIPVHLNGEGKHR